MVLAHRRMDSSSVRAAMGRPVRPQQAPSIHTQHNASKALGGEGAWQLRSPVELHRGLDCG